MRHSVRIALAASVALCASPTFAAECKVQKVVDLPVTMEGTRPTVAAKINGHDVTFIADSGAAFSYISTPVAKQLDLRLEVPPYWLHVGGVGGEADFMLTTVQSFTFANVPIPHVQFIVTAGAGGHESAGLIGQNIWGLADVEYDLGGGAIRMFKPHDCGDRDLAYWAAGKPYNVVPIIYADERDKKVFANVLVNGQRLRVIFDTGASTSVMKMSAAARIGLRPDTPGVKRAGLSTGIGERALRNWIGPVDSFKIGEEEVKNTQLRFGELELGNADMLLGADFFLSHRIYVANSQNRLYFTYNGGPVFNLDANRGVTARPSADEPAPSAPAADAAAQAGPDQPKDADGYARRGAALAGRHDYARAIDDFTKAIELKPEEARYYYSRATARLALKQPLLAMSDLEQVLRLKPDDVDALILRAELRLSERDRKDGLADLDRVAALAPKPADVRLQLGRLYAQMDAYDKAVAEFDLWIAAHEGEGQMAGALGGRCRARVLANLEPGKALNDCNRAIRMGPPTVGMYDARAILELRAGQLDRAIEDYNRSLTINPRFALSLYGRGVARLRKGLASEGDADIAAAVAINARMPESAKRIGIERPALVTPPVKAVP